MFPSFSCFDGRSLAIKSTIYHLLHPSAINHHRHHHAFNKQHQVCTRIEMKSSEFKSLCSHKEGNKKMKQRYLYREFITRSPFVYSTQRWERNLVWVQQIECPFLFLSTRLPYRYTDHGNLQPVAQPQALPYFCVLSSCSVTGAEICMKMGWWSLRWSVVWNKDIGRRCHQDRSIRWQEIVLRLTKVLNRRNPAPPLRTPICFKAPCSAFEHL